MAQTLEKYQYFFTHDLHLSHSCSTEGHLAETSSLKCLLRSTEPNFIKTIGTNNICGHSNPDKMLIVENQMAMLFLAR